MDKMHFNLTNDKSRCLWCTKTNQYRHLDVRNLTCCLIANPVSIFVTNG